MVIKSPAATFNAIELELIVAAVKRSTPPTEYGDTGLVTKTSYHEGLTAMLHRFTRIYAADPHMQTGMWGTAAQYTWCCCAVFGVVLDGVHDVVLDVVHDVVLDVVLEGVHDVGGGSH